jgi:lactose/L-arabinose transport system permease protein
MLSGDITSGKIIIGSNLIENYKILLEQSDYIRAFGNSAVAAVSTTILALFISSIAAYGFEIFSTKLKNRIFKVLLLTMMVPFAALMLPLYKVIIMFGLNNSLISIVLPVISTMFLIFFFRQSFISFPREIIQAARIDGANEFKIFISIVFPSMKPTYAAAAILTFMTSWNNFLWPLITLSSNDVQTLPLKISTLSSSYTPDFGVILLSIVIATLPSIIVFFSLQKYFVAGITGAVK